MRALLRIIACIAVLCALNVPGVPQQAPERKADPFPGWNQRVDETKLDFTHYWPLEEVNATAETLCKRFPELLSMREIGRSYLDRPIYCITFNNTKTGADTDKPAMYIDSNIHGNETQGTEIIFVTIWYLLRN